MLEKYLRPLFQKICVDPLLPIISLSPSLITLFGAFLGLSAALAIWQHTPQIALITLLLSGYCDILDGSVARFRQKASPLGSTLDILSDRLVEFALILGLFGADPSSRGFLCLLMLGSIFLCVTSFFIVGMFTENSSKKSFYYSPGLIERGEAFFFFSAMILFPSWFSLLALCFVLLVLLTTAIRLFQFKNCFIKNI